MKQLGSKAKLLLRRDVQARRELWSLAARPWVEYTLRVVMCALLFATGYRLLLDSPIAWRLRDDVPGGVEGTLLVMAAVLAFVPLAFVGRFLGAYLVSSLVLAGFGAHWWTRVQWEEVITESNFTRDAMPGLMDHLLAASPTFLACAYLALSRWSVLRADLLARGADRDQANGAAASSFLVSGASLLGATAAAVAFAALASSGALRYGLPSTWGGLGVVLAILLVVGAVATLGRSVRLRRRVRQKRNEAPKARARST